MEIIFFATLICALLLGLSYGILFLRDWGYQEYNKLELTLLKIPTPPLKIVITLLIATLTVLCWIEASYVFDSFGMIVLLFIWNGLTVSISALFAHTLLHPSNLKKNIGLALCNKYYFAHNLSAMILFVVLSVVALWLQTHFGLEWNIYAIGFAGFAVLAVFYALYTILAVGIFICYLLKVLYRFAKWLNGTYWNWVLSK